jgi:dimethylaniline monooxygenase (N-oxide forming)
MAPHGTQTKVLYSLTFHDCKLTRCRMEAELRSAVAVAPEKFYTYIKEGKLHPHHSEVSGFKENGIVLKNGEFIEADVVIAATGFTFDLNMLPNHKHLISSDGIHLYRHMIHPDLPDLAFVGFNHGFVHLPTTELGN